MPEETQDVVVDDSLDTTTEDSTEETETEETDESGETEADESDETEEKAEEESTEEEPEYYESEEDYLKQFDGLPENLKSVDDVIKAYQATLPEMKRGQTAAHQVEQLDTILKANGVPDGVKGLLSGRGVQTPQQTTIPKTEAGETYFDPNPFDAVLKQYESQGLLSDDKVKQSYRGLSKFGDQALKPFVQKVENVYTVAMQNIMALRNEVRDLAWKSYEHPQKNQINKTEVFAVMDQYGVENLDKAVSFLALSNPDLLKKISRKAEEEGLKKGQRKLKRFKSIRRGKGVASKKFDYKKYQNPDGSWDNNKLDTLKDFGVEMMEAYKKEYEHKGG